jgi:hypothetical protein
MKIPAARSLALMIGAVAGFASPRGTAQELKSDEAVLFFPAMVWPSGGAWEIEMRAWVFEPERRRLARWLVVRALDLKLENLTPAERTIAEQRIQPFLVDNEGDRRLTVEVGQRRASLPASGPNGHATVRLEVADDELRAWRAAGVLSNQLLRVLVSGQQGTPRPAHVSLLLVPSEGVSVISDIDDTIKVSEVNDRPELLRNTFCRPMEAVTGMAPLYHRLAGKGAVFHYVSASPWQLYEPLAAFTASNGFPAGTFHLKPFRVKDGSFLALFTSPEEYKPPVIEELMARFPERRFILVGDSGERDPEIYGAVARKHPSQVALILIRIPPGMPHDPERWRQAFNHLPPDLWRVFTDPSAVSINGSGVFPTSPNP